MRLVKKPLRIAAILGVLATPALADMEMEFSWGDIPRCTSGRPNTVSNPEFVVSGVPNGTATVEFRLKDLNVPSYNHGGGKLRMSADGKVPSGLFKYKSPCPPNGSHTYQWKATARDASGKVLATAKAERTYP